MNSSRGFTFIEVIVVIVILSMMAAIGIHFLGDSIKIYTMNVNQKTLLDEGKLALERMCRDIRDGNSISSPAAGSSGSLITFTRAHATAQDAAGEAITFRLTGNTLQKEKTAPSATRAMAENVSAFTVSRAASEEITLQLTLSLTSGENVTLQTKVFPKNLAVSSTYKNFYNNWQEEFSS